MYASIAAGIASALLVTVLVLLRTRDGKRLLTLMTRHWASTSNRGSTAIIAALLVVALSPFAKVTSDQAGAPPTHPPLGAQAEVEALRSYAEAIDAGPSANKGAAETSAVADLPDVDVMIAKLVARLDSNPRDVAGWKMLGWSYLNTDRAENAVRAYEEALKIEPGDAETAKGLAAAKSAQSGKPSALQ